MSKSFFTILQDYLRCCCLHTNASGEDGNDGGSASASITGLDRDYSFDDVSSTTPKTPVSWSSSSSLEDYKVAYKRPCFKQPIGIIPTNYYSD
jgi:hypothetical protein